MKKYLIYYADTSKIKDGKALRLDRIQKGHSPYLRYEEYKGTPAQKQFTKDVLHTIRTSKPLNIKKGRVRYIPDF